MATIPTPPVRVQFPDLFLCVEAARSAGWTEHAGHDAVLYMLSGGMTPHGVVLAFLDCKLRVQ